VKNIEKIQMIRRIATAIRVYQGSGVAGRGFSIQNERGKKVKNIELIDNKHDLEQVSK
jgi:hypothetical protein